MPTSFRQSYRKLVGDFGSAQVMFMFLAVGGMALVWAFLSFPQARTIYFALASYHGYMEIAGLGPMIFKKRS